MNLQTNKNVKNALKPKNTIFQIKNKKSGSDTVSLCHRHPVAW